MLQKVIGWLLDRAKERTTHKGIIWVGASYLGYQVSPELAQEIVFAITALIGIAKILLNEKTGKVLPPTPKLPFLILLVVVALPRLAAAEPVSGEGISWNYTLRPVRHAMATVNAGSTDAAFTKDAGFQLFPVSGKQLCLVSAYGIAGGTATALTFNSKGSGAGTAVSPAYTLGANGPLNLAWNPNCHFLTKEGETFTVTTGAGSTIGLGITYIEVERVLEPTPTPTFTPTNTPTNTPTSTPTETPTPTPTATDTPG